ncbi:leucine-rich repeat protein, partial [Flammeovirga aprica]
MNKLIFALLLSVLSFTKTVAQVPHILTKEDVLFEDGEIKDYYGGYPNIIIPQYIEGTEVTSIGNSAFSRGELSSVDFSNLSSLTSIGSYAFSYNNLSSVEFSNLPFLISIGESAFRENNLSSVDFSDLSSLTSIGSSAFYENNLSSVDFSGLSSLTSIGDRAFIYNNLSSVNLKGLPSLVSIGQSAFEFNDLSSVDFSDLSSLTSIGTRAFYKNNLSSVDISNLSSLTSIGDRAFAGNSVLSYTLPTPTYKGDWNLGYSGKEITNLNNLHFYINSEPYEITSADVIFEAGEIKDYLGGYTNIVIPNSINGIEVTSIGEKAFYKKNLRSVDISNLSSLVSIGDEAFRNNFLSNVDFSNLTSLISIGAEAFRDNKIDSINLKELTSLVIIGKSAFSYNYLTYFLLPNPDGDGAWNKGVSGGVVYDRSIAYYFINNEPYELTSADVIFEAGEIKDYLGGYTNIVIPNSIDGTTVTSIGADAFRGNNLSSVDFSSLFSLTTIGSNAFTENYLSSVDFSSLSSLTSIGFLAFSENNLSSLELSSLSSLTTIGSNAFDENNLSSVDLSDLPSLNSIGANAFSNNDLVSVNFSNLPSLISIGEYAFASNDLVSVNLSNLPSLMLIGPSAFASNDLVSVNFSNLPSLNSIGSYAFSYNDLSSVDLSDLSSLISIGEAAFIHNSMLSFRLPNPSFDGAWNRSSSGEEVTRLDISYYYTNSEPYVITSADVIFENGKIKDYLGGYTNIVIPNSFDGITVTSIGEAAFQENNLSNVDLSNISSLTSIGSYAFYYNELISIDLSNLSSLTSIGEAAFRENSLSNVDLSNLSSLQFIGKEAFYYTWVTSFTLPTPNISGIELDGWIDHENNKYPNSSTVTNLDVSYSINIVANNNVIVSTRFQTETGDIIISGDDEKLFEDMRSVSFFVEKGKNITITPEVSGLPDGYYYAPVSFLVEEDINHLFDDLSPIEYSITYESNGGMHANEESYTIESSEITFTSTTKLGYSFEGWYSEPEFTNKVESITSGSTGDVTLYAKYSPIEYSITYESNAGTHANEESYTIESSEITFTSATKLGYTFEGWYSEPEFTNKVESLASGSTGDVILYAKYSPIEYSITYESNGGTHANEAVSFTIESSEITLTSATKLGYTFEGWYSDSEFTNKVASITSGSTGDVTLYAKFTPESYTITYNTDGGEHSNLESYTIESSEITLSEATKLGYTFDGWYSDSEFTSKVESISSGSTGDLTLYAKFKLVSYTITYNTEGGEHSNLESYTIESSEITLTEATKLGYTFEGWYSDSEFTSKVESISSGSTGDLTLYSKYSPIEYSITYESNAGLHTNA